MAFVAVCGNCGKQYKVGDEMAGRTAKCKNCGNMFQIAAPAPAPDEAITLPASAEYAPPAPTPYPQQAYPPQAQYPQGHPSPAVPGRRRKAQRQAAAAEADSVDLLLSGLGLCMIGALLLGGLMVAFFTFIVPSLLSPMFGEKARFVRQVMGQTSGASDWLPLIFLAVSWAVGAAALFIGRMQLDASGEGRWTIVRAWSAGIAAAWLVFHLYLEIRNSAYEPFGRIADTWFNATVVLDFLLRFSPIPAAIAIACLPSPSTSGSMPQILERRFAIGLPAGAAAATALIVAIAYHSFSRF